MLGIKKRIVYTWGLITSISFLFFGIQLSKYFPQIITYVDLITIPLGLSFMITLWYVDQQYDIISTNKTVETVELYIEHQNMAKVADILNSNPNQVRRSLIKFLKKALD